MIRVLHALSGGHIGGTERMVDRLVRGLEGLEFHSEISVFDEPGTTSEQLAAAGFRVHLLAGPHGRIGVARRFAAVLRAGHFDIIHLYGFRVSLVGRMAARLCANRPKVIHGIRGLHVTEGMETNTLRTRAAVKLERLLSAFIDLYVTNSVGAVDFLVSAGLPADKFRVIANGIEPDLWRPSASRRANPTPVVVTIANLRPIKRLTDLVDALALVRDAGVPFRAALIGEGPLRGDLEARIRHHRLEDHVALEGQLAPERVREQLDRSDVFVLPSLWEGMPVSVMEAMSMGLPVIGTDVPGIRELVLPEETGLLVPSGAPAALAQALTRLLVDRRAAAAMGERGRARIIQHFSIERMIAAHAAVYGSLVNA